MIAAGAIERTEAPPSQDAPEDTNSWELPLAISAIITAALTSGVAVLWRSKSRRKPLP